MQIKKLNLNPNPLSDKIITNRFISFKLWLEFEEFSPWDDIENDSANISVNTLDGREYGINVWTFNFLDSARKEESEKGNFNYLISPDLFVKELSRDCIEQVVKALLNKGNLEQILNPSTFGLCFLDPYIDIDAFDIVPKFIDKKLSETKLKLPEKHILKNETYNLLATHKINEDLILELKDGSVAVINSTKKSKKETDENLVVRIYSNKNEFWREEMKNEIHKNREVTN